MAAMDDKIQTSGSSLERSSTSENEKDAIEAKEEPLERTSSSISEKKDGSARVIESPVPEEEQDSGKAGSPGNWRSKVGISFPRMTKWNPSFKPPTLGHTGSVMWKLAKFYGPGAIVSVAYIDPDNYQTAIAAGAEFQFKLLFMILLSNIIAIYLQVHRPYRTTICDSTANSSEGTLCEVGRRHWHDSGRDASHISPPVAQLLPLGYRRSRHHLH